MLSSLFAFIKMNVFYYDNGKDLICLWFSEMIGICIHPS